MTDYRLFLDDERGPPEDGGTWIVVRTYEDFVNAVTDFGFPSHISFDHDLGTEKSGMDCARWLVNHDIDNGDMPENFTYYVHSQNPPGTENIDGLLRNYMENRHDRKTLH